MTSQFSPKVSEVLAYSREEAARLCSRSVGPEHLLLGLLRMKDGPVAAVFKRLGINLPMIKSELEDRVRTSQVALPLDTTSLVLNEKASNILKLAVLEARLQRLQRVDEQHLLLAILHDNVDNGAKEILEANNMTYDDAYSLLQQSGPTDGIDLPAGDSDADALDDGLATSTPPGHQPASAATTQRRGGKTPMLDNFGTDLTKAAAEGKMDPVVGREREIGRVVEIIGRRKKNNPILIGEPGVGKSAIVEGLAQLIAKRHTSPALFGKRLVALDLTSLVAGTKYRGQFEERIKTLIKEIEQSPNVIIFIDEIHTLIGAGSTPGSMDAANILKPALARGTIQCIGATTLDEYRNTIEKDGALERRFQKVMVEATTEEQTIAILNNIKDRYEQHHHVAYTDQAIQACVTLTGRYITDRQFPDKAIDALDETGSRVHLGNVSIPPEITHVEAEIERVKAKKQQAVRSQNFELAAAYRDKQTQLESRLAQLSEQWTSQESRERHTVTHHHVAQVVADITGVPAQQMTQTEGDRLRLMAPQLKSAVIAQDDAIDTMVRAIQRSRVGLRDPNRPIGAFMFLGPTGVGKTHLAKQLAKQLFGSTSALIRIDMSEYAESFNASRLIGAPPGYVGYEQGGQLTERVRRHPYSIVLLDEMEKAHGNVFQLLLQVLDEGRLTDGNGRMVDFRNTVIIMTSNAGTRQLQDFAHPLGFNSPQATSHDRDRARAIVQKALSRQFAPEFLGRLDEIITFSQLTSEAIKSILHIELQHLARRTAQLGYTLNVTPQARELVAKRGYDPQYGARPLRRAMQTLIEDKLCQMLINEPPAQGSTITVDIATDDQSLSLYATPAQQPQSAQQADKQ